MRKHDTASADGAYMALLAAIHEQLPRKLPKMVIEGWLKNKAALKQSLKEGLYRILPDLNWQKAYQELGLETEFQQAKEMGAFGDISPDQELWPVPVLQGLTCKKVIETLERVGVPVQGGHTMDDFFLKENIDEVLVSNDRDPSDGSYCVWFFKTVLPDKGYGKSLNELQQMDVDSITVLERLLLELGYFLASGWHLDTDDYTLCAGSRFLNKHRQQEVVYINWAAEDAEDSTVPHDYLNLGGHGNFGNYHWRARVVRKAARLPKA